MREVPPITDLDTAWSMIVMRDGTRFFHRHDYDGWLHDFMAIVTAHAGKPFAWYQSDTPSPAQRPPA